MKEATLDQATKILSVFKDISTEQAQSLLSSGFLADLRDGNIVNVKRDDFRRMLDLPLLTPPLLESLGTVVISATTKRFVAREHFVENTGGEKASVKISWLSGNFKEWFLAKIEEPMVESALRYAKLLWPSVDSSILTELSDNAETMLTEIFALMSPQPNGESGILLTGGYANIFYVRDITGIIRAVHVHWSGGGWLVRALSVGSPGRWSGGRRVFSRNSGHSETLSI